MDLRTEEKKFSLEGEYLAKGTHVGDPDSGPDSLHIVSFARVKRCDKEGENCEIPPTHSNEDRDSIIKQVKMDIQTVESCDKESSVLPYNNCSPATEVNCDSSCPKEQQVDSKQIPDVMFECQLCKVLFGNKESLKNHVLYNHADNPSLKETLEELETNDSKYKIQTKQTAEEKPAVVTPPGNAPKKRRRKFNRRIACLHPGCGKVFQTAGALKTHSVSHEIRKDCIHCGAVFGTATALIRHIDRRHNPKNVLRLPCSYSHCKEVFKHKSVLEKHIAWHERVLKTCSHCNRSFKLKRQLNDHIRHVHSGDNSTHQLMCQNCGIPMADSEALIKHMETTCVLSDGIVCEFEGCGESFFSRQSLQNHRRKHLRNESEPEVNHNWLYCPNPACDERFQSKKKRRMHLRITQHDVNIDDLPFVCLFRSCATRYASKQEVVMHMKAEHWGNKKKLAAEAAKERSLARNGKRETAGGYIKCPVCHKRFSSDPVMRAHIKTNHAVQPAEGEAEEQEPSTDENTSGQSFLSQSDMEGQPKTYMFDLKMYQCPVCHSSYHTVGRLRVHIESQHRNLGPEFVLLLQRLDNDQESFMDVVKTTLPRDCQYSGPKPKKRRRKKKTAEENVAEDEQQSTSDQTPTPGKSTEDLTTSDEEHGVGEDPGEGTEGLEQDGLNTSDTMEDNGETDVEKDEDSSSPKKSPQKYAGAYFCRFPSCSSRFDCKTDLVKHQKTHSRNLKCSHFGCNAEFFSMVNLRGHIKLVHSNSDVLTCKQCGRVGKGKSFRKHMEECKETTPLYMCQVCGKAFPRKSSYKNHLGVHKEKSAKNLKRCQYEGCNKEFKSNQDLNRHINVHTGERPHACPYGGCNKTYKQRPHLLVHLKTHSVIDDGKEKEVFPCEYCGFPFKHRCGKLKHLRNSCVKGPNKEKIIERISRRRRQSSTTSQE